METKRERKPARLTQNMSDLRYLLGKVHALGETWYFFQFVGETETVNLTVANVFPGKPNVADNCSAHSSKQECCIEQREKRQNRNAASNKEKNGIKPLGDGQPLACHILLQIMQDGLILLRAVPLVRGYKWYKNQTPAPELADAYGWHHRDYTNENNRELQLSHLILGTWTVDCLISSIRRGSTLLSKLIQAATWR